MRCKSLFVAMFGILIVAQGLWAQAPQAARVKSTMTLFYEIRREIARQPEEILAGSLKVKLHPSVADRIRRCHLELSAGLRRAPRGGLRSEEDPSVPIGRFELVPATGARL